MSTDDFLNLGLISASTFAAVYVFVAHAWTGFVLTAKGLERRADHALNHNLMLNIPPRAAAVAAVGIAAAPAMFVYFLVGGLFAPTLALLGGLFLPAMVVRHLEQKRAQRLEYQLVDALTTLASAVRAGLTLVQAIEVLVKNSVGPVQQEFGQLLREYQMGLDLNHAMRNASNRIGSPSYRLVFTAIEMHRRRGGDTGESLDRIADSIREIQRLEAKLDALTAQGRFQAWLMAAMPVALLIILYLIDSEGVTALFTEPLGRLILLGAVALIVVSCLWIRKIMRIDI